MSTITVQSMLVTSSDHRAMSMTVAVTDAELHEFLLRNFSEDLAAGEDDLTARQVMANMPLTELVAWTQEQGSLVITIEPHEINVDLP